VCSSDLIYAKTTNYGHFGKDDPEITWEVTNKADALRKAVSKASPVGAATLRNAMALVKGNAPRNGRNGRARINA
jgi:hypothetical protein